MIRLKEVIVLILALSMLIQSVSAISNVQHSVDGDKVTLTYQGTPPFWINIRGDTNIGQAGGYLWAKTYSNSFSYDMSFAMNPSKKFYYGIKDTSWSPVYIFNLDSSFDYNCQKLLYTGNPQDKINLFFISDGFNDSTIEYFYKNIAWGLDLEGKSNGLFSKAPYKELKNRFNIYTISSTNIFDCLLTHNSGPNAKPCNKSKIMEIPKDSCGISKVGYVVLVGYPYSPVNPNEKRSGIWNADAISIVLADLVDRTWIEASVNHEVGGHGIGGLGDEYYDSNIYKESWNIWPNIDRDGCPKWCSGIMNISNPCYSTYTEWKKCVQPYLDQTCLNGNEEYKCGSSANIRTCNDLATQKELIVGRPLINCNIGINCVSQTGCYWGAGYSLANFRSTEESIMKSAYVDGTYGPIGIKEISKRIGEET